MILQGEADPRGRLPRVALAIVPPGNVVRDLRAWVAGERSGGNFPFPGEGLAAMLPEALYLAFFSIPADRAARDAIRDAVRRRFGTVAAGLFGSLPERLSFDHVERHGNLHFLAPGGDYHPGTVLGAALRAGTELGLIPAHAPFEPAAGILLPIAVSSAPPAGFTIRRMELGLFMFRTGSSTGSLSWTQRASAARKMRGQ